MAGNLDLVDDVPAAQLKNVKADLGDRYINTPAGIIQTLAFPFYDKDWNKAGMEKVRQGLSRGHRPRPDHRHHLPEDPHPRHRLDLPGPRRGGRLQGRACAVTPASTTRTRPRS